MSHNHDIVDAGKHFVIDPALRTITTEATNLIVVQGDHNSERYTFEIPQYVEGHDMSLCNRIEVHFDNISKSSNDVGEGLYIANDAAANGDVVNFSWLISGNATRLAGTISFWLNFVCVDKNGEVIYAWGTDVFKRVTVIESNRNTEAVIHIFPDVLEQWKKEVIDDIGVPDSGGNADYVTPQMYGAKGDGVEDDTAAVQAAVDSGKEVYFPAGTYLIAGISAQDVCFNLSPYATIKRSENGYSPFININPNGLPGGYITKKSYIRGGEITCGGAGIGVAINRSEQFTVETYITECVIGLYLGYTQDSAAYPKYIIEARVVNTKLKNSKAYAGSTGIVNDGTDCQFSNIVIENFAKGVKTGGNDVYHATHHWNSKTELMAGSVSFDIPENISAFFSGCCSDSVETCFLLGSYSQCFAVNTSQIASSLYNLDAITYVSSAYPATIVCQSKGSRHECMKKAFYMTDDAVYARYENQKQLYFNRVSIESFSIINAASQNNIIPSGFNRLGNLKTFLGMDQFSRLSDPDLRSLTTPGFYTFSASTVTSGDCPFESGQIIMIVAGSTYYQLQVLFSNTGAYYRIIASGSVLGWHQITTS